MLKMVVPVPIYEHFLPILPHSERRRIAAAALLLVPAHTSLPSTGDLR